MDFVYSIIFSAQILTFFNIYLIESLLKMTKNVFYFILKALFVLEIFKFLSRFFGYKLYKTLDYWSGDMLNLNFPKKSLGLVSPPHFAYDFSRKLLLMLHSINWPNFIASLPLLLQILGNICVAIVCFPAYDVTNFEINLIFLIKSLWYRNKKSRQKLKYIENEKSFWDEIKSIYSSFLKGSRLPKMVSDLRVRLLPNQGNALFTEKTVS